MLERMKRCRSEGRKRPQAPSINRSFEGFKKCRKKRTFSSRAAAKKARELPDGTILFPYRCQICLQWHLTTDNRRQRILAKENEIITKGGVSHDLGRI